MSVGSPFSVEITERPQSCHQPWAPRARPSEELPDKGMQRGFGRTEVVMIGFQNLNLKKKTKKKKSAEKNHKDFLYHRRCCFPILTTDTIPEPGTIQKSPLCLYFVK